MTLRDFGTRVKRRWRSWLPWQLRLRPIFLIGCGRSGTTAFGHALAQHPHVLYLNEPRELWFAAYPETDIWTDQAAVRGGRLLLTAEDSEPAKTAKLRRLFADLLARSGRRVLIEKLPINNFRLELIHRIFPHARFLHLYRNGLEVARSIEKVNDAGGWFASSPFKWERLAEYAERGEETSTLPVQCASAREKGLLEWRLSTEAAVGFLQRLPEEMYWEGSYAELVRQPAETLAVVQRFIGLEPHAAVERYAVEKIARQTASTPLAPLTDIERSLGGALLPRSQTLAGGLTQRD